MGPPGARGCQKLADMKTVFLPAPAARGCQSKARQNQAVRRTEILGAVAARGCQKNVYEGCVSTRLPLR